VLETGGASFEDWLSSRSKNFRDQVRRRERKLAKSHDLAFRLTDDPERLDDDLSTLIRLHRERWGDESGSFEGPREAFHRDFAGVALERGWLRLWTLELDGRPAASWLGYRFGGAEWYYQAGRDPALEKQAVGFVLMAHTVRAALDDGMREYRLLLGGEGYKDRFANADHGLHTVMLGRGPVGTPVAAAAGAAASRPALRARLKRFAR
jgi:CelD/BcsL family acetyltransferase involved in cellulose biosynthesis